MVTSFSPLKVNGGFLLPWKPEFWSNLPQNLIQPFPHLSDATHKIWSRLANCLQRYSSLKVWTTDGRQTIGILEAHLLSLYYKLTLSAFCSGELTSSPKGNDRSPESNVPRSICPKTLCSCSPTQMMLHIKFDQDWPTGFRDIQAQKCEIFVTQGQVTPKWVVWIGPKSNSTELLCLSWLSATLMMIR